MLMLALLPIGLLALRCVDTLATRFGDLLFDFFVIIISTLVARSTCRCCTQWRGGPVKIAKRSETRDEQASWSERCEHT